jgi:hypothetical protein
MPDTFSRAFHHGAGCAEFHRGGKDLTSEMFALLADNKKQTGTVADTHVGFESMYSHPCGFGLGW